MFAFEAAVEALRVQNAIDLGSARPMIEIRTMRPQPGKSFRLFPAAFETGPVTGGKRGHFVEEEKLGVVLSPHIAMTSVEFQAAADPGATDVPPFAQGPIVAMKSSAAVSQQGPARVDGDELTEGVNAIL
jgi:hypothetical protein